jgi:molybdate transport system ATP-binding protein
VSININFDGKHGDFAMNIDLQLQEQGITAIFGSSGCGKTSILRMIAGLDKWENAKLKIGDVVWQDENIFIPPHERSIGYVFQEASLFAHLNVRQNLNYGIKRNGKGGGAERAIELLDIGHILHREVGQLSGGERQRVAIARALSVSPKILLMDEPLSALDDKLKMDIMPYLDKLHKELKIPIIYVSHSLDEVSRLADQLVLLENGKVLETGGVGELFTNPKLSIGHGTTASSLVVGMVEEHDKKYGLSYVTFSGGKMAIATTSQLVGDKVRMRLHAKDISITLKSQINTSILNIFDANIVEIVEEGRSHLMVYLMVGEDIVLSLITNKSAELLNLKKGNKVFAQIKCVSLFA